MRPLLFIQYNAVKLVRILPLAWAIIVAIMLVAGWQSGISVSALLVHVMVGSIGPAFIFTVIAAIRGWWHFRPVETLLLHDGPNSLLPLLADGYTIEPTNTDSRFFFTGERLRTSISGLPVTISFSHEPQTKRLTLVCAFYPLLHAPTGTESIQKATYYTGIRHHLSRDLKPDILAFAAGLKEQGYVVTSHKD